MPAAADTQVTKAAGLVAGEALADGLAKLIEHADDPESARAAYWHAVAAAAGTELPDSAGAGETSGQDGSRGLLDRAVDLGALVREGIPPVDYMRGELARRMVYAAGVTGFTGHPEAGKTTLVCRLAADAMRAGQHVVYFDYENGEQETVRRFAALDVSDRLLSGALTYVPFPGRIDWSEVGAVWDRYPEAVGVWDSTRGILRTLGINEDKASEVGTFMDPLVEFSLTRGVPFLLIDHVTKAATAGSGYARGSGDKLAAVQAQWYVERIRPFSEVESGEIALTRWKARSGALVRAHRFAVGDGNGALMFRRLDPDDTPEGRIDKAVIAFLRERHPESCSQRAVEEAVDGTATVVRDRLKALAEDPSRPVATDETGQHPRYLYDPEADHEPSQRLDF